jgi:ribosomal protein L14
MPYHTVDPLKKSNKYKDIGNRSKNDLVLKDKRKNKHFKEHKNKQYKYTDYIIKQNIKAYKKSKGVSFELQNNSTIIFNVDSEKEVTKIEIPVHEVIRVIENELEYQIPSILLI